LIGGLIIQDMALMDTAWIGALIVLLALLLTRWSGTLDARAATAAA
jgi:MFS transporter, DHA1 family, inner membrane transport protein